MFATCVGNIDQLHSQMDNGANELHASINKYIQTRGVSKPRK